MGDLDGKIAVVAGATRGIGKGIALELGGAGALVYASGRTLEAGDGEPSLMATAGEITELGGEAVSVPCDLTDDAQVAALFDRVRQEQGHLDVLVNAVFDSRGLLPSIGRPFWELSTDIWRTIVDLGTRTAYVASSYAAPLLLANGGMIVNISGRGASQYRYNVAYGTGKAALDRMTRDMSADLRPYRVAVVSLWPAVTKTESVERNARDDPSLIPGGIEGLSKLETPRFAGRAVVALAKDPDLERMSGQRFWVAELARRYGFTDEYGQTHEVPEEVVPSDPLPTN